jgi:2-iminobutanoate/2-iminopropanoate deaminase
MVPGITKEVVRSGKGPKPIGPYSAGVIVAPFVFISGQIGLDREGNLVGGGVEAQTTQALTNLEYLLVAARSGMEHVVKTTVFMADLTEFPRMNEVYGRFFQVNPPARSTVQVSSLPKGALVEIEAIALIPD